MRLLFGFAQRMFLLSGNKEVQTHYTFEPGRPEARQHPSF